MRQIWLPTTLCVCCSVAGLGVTSVPNLNYAPLSQKFIAGALKFAHAPSTEQRGFMSYLQFQLGTPPDQEDFESELTVDDVTDAIDAAAAACERGTEIEIFDRASLVQESIDALYLYLDGSRDALSEYWESKGLTALADDSPIFQQDVWNACSRTLQTARLSTSVVAVRPLVLDGRPISISFTLPVSSGEVRAERHPSGHARRTVYEVVLGVEPLDANGNRFRGYVGLWLTLDPDADPDADNPEARTPTWVLTGMAIYNRPARVGVVLPVL